jgi:hypothetical protein
MTDGYSASWCVICLSEKCSNPVLSMYSVSTAIFKDTDRDLYVESLPSPG